MTMRVVSDMCRSIRRDRLWQSLRIRVGAEAAIDMLNAARGGTESPVIGNLVLDEAGGRLGSGDVGGRAVLARGGRTVGPGIRH